MKKNLFYAIVLGSASLGFVGWRVLAVQSRPTTHFEIVEDPSLSHPEGCASLMGLAERALRTDSVTTGSTLAVLVLGDASTSDEPWELGKYPIPTISRAMESRTASLRRQEGVLDDIRAKCEAIHRTTVSPIFLGIKQAIADLRAEGCKKRSQCEVWVDSDLEENVESSVKRNLEQSGSRKSPALDNSGIRVTLCGIAVTSSRVADSSGRRISRGMSYDSNHEDRLQEVWRSLFTEPSAVTFEPYCPVHAPVSLR